MRPPFCGILFLMLFSCANSLLYDKPCLRNSGGHLILESRDGKNVTLNGGYVNVNGVDISNAFSLIQRVKPQLVTLATAPLSFLLSNLTSVVQSLSSETRLAQKLDSIAANATYTTNQVNLLKSDAVSTKEIISNLVRNLSRIGENVLSEEKLNLLRNLTRNLTQLQSNAANGGSMSANEVQRINNKLSSLEAQTAVIEDLDDRLLAVENVVNDTREISGETTTTTTVSRRIRRLERRVNTLDRKMQQIRTHIDRNICTQTPCLQGGTCIDTVTATGYHCLCPEGWEGPNCSQDVNECVGFISTNIGCQNGAVCRNIPGSYICTCSSGWYGVHCTAKEDSCNSNSNVEICGHGTCIPSSRGAHPYTCICDQGYRSSSFSPACVVDINECIEDRPPCSKDPVVNCINTDGAFHCGPCPQGYIGNGLYCTDIDECQINNGGCSIYPRVECINTRPFRKCGPCPPGYSGNGETCMVSGGPCQMNPCHIMAICYDNPSMSSTYYTCTCRTGYSGNGMGSNGCTQVSTTNTGQSGPCQPNPCVHGTCSSHLNQYTCTCLAGYTGSTCNVALDACVSSPCLNGGTCWSTSGGFGCLCPSSHTGTRCELQTDQCSGDISGTSGIISYPEGNLQTYDHDVSCTWVIRVNYTMVVTVTFTHFELEPSYSCRADFLEIRDGPRTGSRLLYRSCGNEAPGINGTLVGSHSSMYLRFKSDHTHASDGFTLTWNATTPDCGGELSGEEHGVIKSPGYPETYPTHRDCFWKVQINPGKKIQFAFAAIGLETHANCSYDKLVIYDGLTERDPVLGTYCSSVDVPAPITTSGAEALVYFHSDMSQTDTGFLISYTSQPGIPGCGGVFTGTKGEISVPTTAGRYHHNMRCEWLIRVHPDEKILLTFTDFQLEHHSTCGYDVLEIHDGKNAESPLLGRYCSDVQPEPITSTRNSLFVSFTSDSSRSYEGFTAKYILTCGGKYGGSVGYFHSPYFPDPYPDSRTCEYVIKQPAGKAIVLNFTSFDIEGPNGTCPYDYVEIRDGLYETSPLIGHYCGQHAHRPPIIISTLNALWIQFRTDGWVSHNGFYANYSTIDTRCGGIHHNLTGTINSPNSPAQYLDDPNCMWVIDVPSSYVIQLNWISFNLEGGGICRSDYIEVYDNSTVTGTGGLVGGKRYCGTTRPPSMTSLSNIMTIVFHSDSSVNHDAFSLAYHALPGSTFCGGNYYTTSGMVQSPLYPNGYPDSRTCIWTISVPQGNQMRLVFEDVDIEESYLDDCRHDYLEIRNGGYITSPLIKKICGRNETVNEIFSHSHQLHLKFSSDYYYSGRGFRLFWSEAATGCGATMTSVTGEFMSPGYPQPYHRRAECYWTIRTNKGSKVTLTFIDFKLQDSPFCYRDYVEVRDGPYPSSKLLGRFCSTQIFLAVNSSSNSMWIKFKGGWFPSERGFRAVYTSDCNVELFGPTGVIESPNFPGNYPHMRNCTWIIKAPLGNSLNVSFSHFEVEDPQYEESNVCEYDFVEIRVGQTDTAGRTVKGHYCGKNNPPALNSGSKMNLMEVQFKSDWSVAHNGFRMEYVVSGCGGILNGQTGTFSSPNYPNAYPTKTTCEWHIEVMAGYRVKITIQEFDIESSMDGDECLFDSLNIYGGKDITSPLLLHLCHHQNKPTVVETQGNYAFASIISDISVRGRGFTASYQAVEGGCGGTFTASRGVIHSPNYPSDYDDHTDCIWNLSVDENHVVLLNFTDFAVEPHNNCSYDYVRIFDGDSTDSPIILFHCGSTLPDPPVISSSANKMTVRLKADSSQRARGFSAVYRPGCGAALSATLDSQGKFISSPNFPKLLNRALNCTWHIEAPEGYKVRLIFTHLNIEKVGRYISVNDSLNCENDYVAVYNGIDLSSPRINKYCGSHVPLPVISTGRYLTVHIQSVWADGVGFRAMYSALDTLCGGYLSSISGSLASPNYPDSYPTFSDCTWNIHAGLGNRIQLSFSVFNLEESDHCNRDYLEVHQGSAAGPLLLHNCSNTIPSEITVDNDLWIRFKTDGEGTSDGFLATFTILPGNVIYSDRGVISSPLYPQVYIRRGQFTYQIIVTPGYYVMLRVTNIAIEVNPTSDVCFSSLVIHDGADAESAVLKTLCGYEVPRQYIVTSSNVAFVRFISNHAHEGSSFRLIFRAVSDFVREDSIQQGFDKNCTFRVRLSNYAHIKSPGYPQNYTNNLKCEWIVETNATSRIELFTGRIDLEESEGCIYDKVELYDGLDGTTNWNLSKTICKRADRWVRFISSGKFMRIVFKSDWSVNKKGFDFYLRKSCGGVFIEPDGVINQLSSSFKYRACEYKIKVRPGRTISFTFTAFNIPNETVTCRTRHLLAYNGPTDASPYLGTGRYCGTTIPSLPESSSNEVFLKYKDLYRFGNRGFRLRYREVSAACGGEYQLIPSRGSVSTVEFNSPNYPNPPHPHTECSWTITSTQGKTINLNFIDTFDITGGPYYSSRCDDAYVEVHDGGTALSPLLGRFCGTNNPNSLTSKDNVLFVRFYTNAEHAHTGFKARASIGDCGGTHRMRTGQILSPNYPEPYSPNTNCSWSIIGPMGHSFILKFPEFSVYNRDTTCSTGPGRVIINDTLATNVTKYLCGIDQVELPFETASNQMTINFTSGQPHPAVDAKFRIVVNTSIEECGSTYVGTGGVITSPGYPHGTAKKWYCPYFLRSPEGTRIKVEFEDIQLARYGNSNYCMAYIWLRNGIEPRSPWMKGPTCLSSELSTVSSSMNEMKIVYSSYSTAGKGFKLRWSADEPQECGGVITDSSGILESPQPHNETSGFYNQSVKCVWNIQNPNPSNSSINITVLSRQFNRYCGEYLFIQSIFPSGTPAYYKRFCSEDEHTNFMIPYPTARITFVARTSSYKILPGSFNLTYSIINCGGYLVGPESVITSPNYPQNYPPNSFCVWILDFPSGSQIELNFTEFKLEDSMNHDFVRILNGPHADSPVEGQYTGQTSSNIVSGSNQIRIIFESDATTSEKGFRAVATVHTRGCAGIYHANQGSISSPGFAISTDYTSNMECRWEIRVKPGYFVAIKFVEQFDVETSPNCQNDFVQISARTNTSLGNSLTTGPKLCGKEIPKELNSTGDKVHILFRSNNEINGRGFKLQWLGKCGGFYTDKEGFIMSPNHPMYFPSYTTCEYHIIAKPGSYITLNFTSMQIGSYPDGDSRCYSKLIIKEHYMGRYWTNRTICGTELPDPILFRGHIILRFISRYNRYRKDTGFKLHYKIEDCGGNITEPGDLTIPRESSGNYDNHMECRWDIIAPPGKVILLKFQQLVLEYHRDCKYDYLSVYKSLSSSDDQLLNRYCGDHSQDLPILNTNSSSSRVIFSSDYAVTRSDGFKATVQFTYGCGDSKLISNDGDSYTFRSPDPDNDGDYEPYLSCTWNFVGNENMVLMVNFSRLEVEGATVNDTVPCPHDFIEIHDGPSRQSPLLAKLCGSTLPTRAFIGTRNSLTVKFVSDSMNELAGFTATVKNEPRVCGGGLTATLEAQSLQTPGYSEGYPVLTKCFWLITAPSINDSIHMEINDFNLEESHKCKKDWVYFHEGRDELSVVNSGSDRRRYPAVNFGGQEGHFPPFTTMDHFYCGTHIAHSINSNGHDVGIYFNSDEEGTAPGIRLHYSLLTCNRTYTGHNGHVTQTKTEYCYMTINAPEGSYVALYLFHLYFQTQSASTFKVFDGTSGDANMLADYSNHVGYNPNPVYATGSSMFVQATASTGRVWYSFTFAASDKPNGCGGTYYGKYFIFGSPNYPSEPETNQTCLYTVTVSSPFLVSLSFAAWDFTANDNCSSTNLQIANILPSGEVGATSTYCGTDEKPAIVNSPTNRLIVNFQIGPGGMNGTGWRAIARSFSPHQEVSSSDEVEE